MLIFGQLEIFFRKQLMDSLTISKEEDMARLQSMALLLLAKLHKSKLVLKQFIYTFICSTYLHIPIYIF
jgi:hypothetical protein